MAASYKQRIQQFEDCLAESVIDLKKLRELCFSGIPDTANIRSKCWKILLNYLPPEKDEWEKQLKSQRDLYVQFCNEVIIAPGRQMHGIADKAEVIDDHPLNPNPNSQWSQFFKDNEVLLQIDKDTRRLQPDLGFFQSPTDFPCEELLHAENMETLRKRVEHTLLSACNVERNRTGITNISTSKKKSTAEFGHDPCPEGKEAHWEVTERILFIYAKLNPGQGYVQGMNEIIGPIYYVFASDTEVEWRKHAEEDAFFCFTNLMSQVRDIFIKTLDNTQDGIVAKMVTVMRLLKKHDIEVWTRISTQGLRPEFFAFRWLTLLLSQEFPLPDVIRVWDSLLSDRREPEFILYVCCAMITLQRKAILNGDYANNIKLLQRYPSVDIHILLKKAVELRDGIS